MSPLVLLTAVMLSQPMPKPPDVRATGSAAPTVFVLPGFRLHVYASEDLDPDSLGLLAWPGVVLWLETRSNTLRASTVQRLKRFGEAWVELRAPIRPGDVGVVASLPRTGLWVRDERTLTPALSRIGVSRLAVELDGQIAPERFDLLERLMPARVGWSTSTVDLARFGRFVQQTGARVLRVTGTALQCDATAPVTSSLRETALVVPPGEVARAMSCGFVPRVVIDPDIDDDSLRMLFTRAPNAELEVHVGTDERRALATRKLIERLEAAAGTPSHGR